ncbi:hypothetical protein EMIHUDRAFT_122222 [Emiliania huxleyi CCMP1516]|uniref:Myosin motor domain-containing protein n=2 Tax=Emiliania huxleyi TaxID=2903 RepID=A0A0D3KRZ1_EMIH1|nr:hypothetical protein EMIHUDRAFT_122222 [Emiliania huxleyi CCMP1516]EOD38526.1 hypothetical protein EMIHUDRAFT_122222 [Emiliania huxleyi CCMP1516]|eukprot:XP_005790955.1 hypothetical protein EMIHUDRAFT_122222 [Emiliania huxleyi CCMP1516]
MPKAAYEDWGPGCSELSSLKSATDKALLDNTEERYKAGNIYTRSGRLLLAVNPYITLLPLSARLAADLHKYANGSLWLEFFYEEQLAAVRAAFATPGVVDDEAVLAQVKKAVMSNGWSDAFNQSLVDLLRLAHQHSISIHALDSPEWSLDAFTERYGTFRGRLKYLANRASQENDGEGATSRWAKRVMEEHAEGTAPAPVVVMGGAEHGPVMLEIVPVFEFMYEDAGAVRAAAKAKVEAELAAAKEAKSEAEEEEEAAEAKIGSALALFSR